VNFLNDTIDLASIQFTLQGMGYCAKFTAEVTTGGTPDGGKRGYFGYKRVMILASIPGS
jgi:hypothetical protein